MTGRRRFLKEALAIAGSLTVGYRGVQAQQQRRRINTVLGEIHSDDLGITLIHEHVLVDFSGAAHVDESKWNPHDVLTKVTPYFSALKRTGCNTLVDCTPNYLGRDVALLKMVSEHTKVQVITNTGYYGGSDHKFLPPHAFVETEDQLAKRWMEEWSRGIDGTAVKPGFIKISVNSGALSDISKKLIRAAGITSQKTGLTIMSHTGPYEPAAEQIEILKSMSVDPSAFVWVHAQTEKEPSNYIKVVKDGSWVSLDGLSEGNVKEYADLLAFMKENQCLHRTLISHDAGWYDPAKEGGGEFRPYTTLFSKLLPELKAKGFTKSDVDVLLKTNPRTMLT